MKGTAIFIAFLFMLGGIIKGHVVLIFAAGFASIIAIINGWKWAFLEQRAKDKEEALKAMDA